MVTKHKPTGRAAGFPKGIALGTLAAMASTAALAALLAMLIASGAVREENLGYGVMVLLFLSAALGGTVAFGRDQTPQSTGLWLVGCGISRQSDGADGVVFRRSV